MYENQEVTMYPKSTTISSTPNYVIGSTVGDFMSEDGGIYIIRNGFLIKVGQAKMESNLCSH